MKFRRSPELRPAKGCHRRKCRHPVCPVIHRDFPVTHPAYRAIRRACPELLPACLEIRKDCPAARRPLVPLRFPDK